MKRVKLETKDTKWKPGREKTGGRVKGTRNRMTVQLKQALLDAAVLAGDLLEDEEEAPEGGAVGYLAWLARNEPAVYGRMLEKLLPLQLNARHDGAVDHNHKYETLEDLAAAFKQRGLPPPATMIDVTPNRERSREDA